MCGYAGRDSGRCCLHHLRIIISTTATILIISIRTSRLCFRAGMFCFAHIAYQKQTKMSVSEYQRITRMSTKAVWASTLFPLNTLLHRFSKG